MSFLLGAMKLPRFASPLAREWREYYRALHRSLQKGEDLAVARPEDPLVVYREARSARHKKPISLRVDEHLLALTKEVARQHGLRYQVVIRLWIEEGLRRAIREAAEDPEPSPLVPRT